MNPDPRVILRFAACRELCLSGPAHTPDSLKAYNAERAREYAKAQARLAAHPQASLLEEA